MYWKYYFFTPHHCTRNLFCHDFAIIKIIFARRMQAYISFDNLKFIKRVMQKNVILDF